MEIKLKDIEEGLIIGPDEDDATALRRKTLLEKTFSYPPPSVDHFLTDPQKDEAIDRVEKVYGMRPEKIIAFYSDKRLSFFQGGAMWVHEKNHVRVPLIQLRKGFEKGRYLLYRRSEVLSHELVHAMRIAFDEPNFEEIFAYRTSIRGYRRFFGPIFQRQWEGYVFIATLFVPLFVPFNLPLYVFGLLLLRLCCLHFVLFRTRRWFEKQMKKPKSVWSLLLQLTDREILSFGLFSNKKRKTLLKEKKDARWKLLKKSYL